MKKLDINKVSTTTFILFLICALVTAALAGTNYITKSRIADLAEETKNATMKEVLPAKKHEPAFADIDGKKCEYYAAKDENGEIIGYITTAVAKGYGGNVEVMVGMDINNAITAVKVISAADETPGLGMNVTKKKFYGQFTGMKADYSEFTAVTGATISSKAVDTAVKEALSVLTAVNNGEVK